MTTPAIALPQDLAPTLRQRVLELVAQVSLAKCPPAPTARGRTHAPRCVVCHKDGKLGGHHGEDCRDRVDSPPLPPPASPAAVKNAGIGGARVGCLLDR